MMLVLKVGEDVGDVILMVACQIKMIVIGSKT